MAELLAAGAAGFALGFLVTFLWLRRIVRVAERAYQVTTAEVLREHRARAPDGLLADLEHRARYWRQPGIGDFAPKDLAHDFAQEIERAVVALRTNGVALPQPGQEKSDA